MVVSKTRKKQPQKHVKQTKFTQSCCKFSVNHSPRVQYVQLKSNSKNFFYLLDIFFILCIYFFWTNNKNQTIKHMHNVLLFLKYHSDTLSILRLVPKNWINRSNLSNLTKTIWSRPQTCTLCTFETKNSSIYKLRKNLRIFIPKAVEHLTNTRNGANFDTKITFTKTRHNRTDLHDNSEHKG